MSSTVRRLWVQLTADRKRFTVLCVVLGLGVLFWARLIVVSNVPRTAVADPPELSGSLRADKALTGSAKRAAAPIAIELSALATRDPFVISPVYFPRPTSETQTEQQAPKSQSQPAEDGQQIQARRAALLRTLAERLKLEAAVGSSMAVINGRSYRVGDWIPAPESEQIRFQLVDVRQRAATLHAEGHSFELHMTLPGG